MVAIAFIEDLVKKFIIASSRRLQGLHREGSAGKMDWTLRPSPSAKHI